MSETPVDELEGRELDAAVAEEVFGAKLMWREEGGVDHPYADRTLWTKWCPTCGYDGHWNARAVPHYSTDIAAAWEVATEVGLWVHPGGEAGKAIKHTGFSAIELSPSAIGKDAPEAICRAALKAVRG